MTKSEFEDEIHSTLIDLGHLSTFINTLEGTLKRKDVPSFLTNLRWIAKDLSALHNFIDKYSNFFTLLEEKFGIEIKSHVKSAKGIISELTKDVAQIKIFFSQRKSDLLKDYFQQIRNKNSTLQGHINEICILPERIDYSKLSSKEWRMIGIAGIHYQSKIYLSYPYRDDDPKKDENQKMIDNYIQPLLALLNIKPIIARNLLKPQELINDRNIELIKDCDGIIGFFTKDDNISNVEHEISQHENVIAICTEVEAETPSLRLSRLQINFNRDEMGDLLIDLIKAVKHKKLFNLLI